MERAETRAERITAGPSAPGAPLDAARADARAAPPRASPTPAAKRRLGVRILLLTAFCFGLGQTVIFAVLPPIAREAGLSERQVGMIFGVSAVFWVLSSPRWGRRSDEVGRRPIVLLGLAAFVISMLALTGAVAVAMSGALTGWAAFGLMALTRSGHGAFGAAGPAASQAYIADRSSADDRTSALAGFAAAFGIGTTAGPTLGAMSAHLGVLAPLVMVALAGLASFVLIWRFVPEATPPRLRGPRAKLSPFDPRLRATLAYGLLSGFVTAVQLQLIVFYLIDTLGLTQAEGLTIGGAALTISAAASLFAQLVLVQRLRPSPRRLMRSAPILCAIGFVIIASGDSFAVIAVGLVLSGLGTGMSYPAFNAAASLSVGQEEQGGAAGLATAAGASGFILAPLVASALYDGHPSWPFLLGAVVALAMAGIAWAARD